MAFTDELITKNFPGAKIVNRFRQNQKRLAIDAMKKKHVAKTIKINTKLLKT